MNGLSRAFAALSNVKLSRLLSEDDGVEGCGYFHRRPEQPLHVLGNIMRIVFTLWLAPLYLLTPRAVVQAVSNFMQSNWRLEYATALDSVLTSALGKGDGRYEVIEFEPRWVLKVTLQDNRLHWKQVPFSNEIKRAGYTALSYPVDSAVVLATENNFKWSPKPADRDYTLKDRRTIAEYLLKLYLTTDGREWNQDRVEYIWLDEWCLSDRSGWDTRPDKEEDKHRGPEIGRLADIFRGAAQTVIFCHEEDCDHTGLKCIWGHRLWTIAEILHAQTVLPMTRRREGTELKAYISRTSGSAFRAAMQAHAARGNRWHLYSIFQHTVNAGAVSWQVAIHALVVEAIRRDDKNSKYHEHKHLGRALNGLLPRRARTSDFGAGGWSDLAWLLELNQGFYNAASLAAVCGVADAGATVSWLGKPIHPAAGNERLEPVVTAFPQAVSGAADPLLTIIGCETLGLRPTPLKRDSYGLYNNEEMRPIKWLAIFPCALLVIGGAQFLSQGNFGMFFLLVYISTILYCIVEMIVSTMFLERCGWAYFEDTMYGDKLELKLGEQDHNLRNLTHWGDRQMVPKWEAPGLRPCFAGKLVDLKNRICVRTAVVDRPNALVPLAVHGSGVTCMLLTRPKDAEKEPTCFAQKVGMCNMPPYIFAQTQKSGTIYVGHQLEHTAEKK